MREAWRRAHLHTMAISGGLADNASYKSFRFCCSAASRLSLAIARERWSHALSSCRMSSVQSLSANLTQLRLASFRILSS